MFFDIDDFETMRQALREVCARFSDASIPDETAFDVRLIANELLSNVLRHGGGRARLKVELCGTQIRVSVKGEEAYRPPCESRSADVYAESGRGLFLVDALSSARTYSEEEGVCVVVTVRQ